VFQGSRPFRGSCDGEEDLALERSTYPDRHWCRDSPKGMAPVVRELIASTGDHFGNRIAYEDLTRFRERGGADSDVNSGSANLVHLTRLAA
jgi:hypothetical protein